MSGVRLIVGVIVMAIAVPITIAVLLGMHSVSQFFTVAAVTFVAWGVSDLLSTILERPRLQNRSPGHALREDWERRASSKDEGA